MTFPNFDPVLIHLGPLAIRWYALAYVAGILLGWRYAIGFIRKPQLWPANTPPTTELQIDDAVLWITLGIILGGRLGYVTFYDPAVITHNPLEILQVWHGGMSFHGGLIGVVLALVIFARVNRIPMLSLGDLVAPAVPIGLFFGRLANFINGELWGRPTSAPWGMVFCSDHIREANNGQCPAGLLPRHPSQLYEATLEGIVLFVVLRLAAIRFGWLKRRGAVTGLFLLLYGLFRVSLENVRNPDIGMPDFPLGLTMGMMLSIPMILLGAWLLWRAFRQPAEIEVPAAEAVAEAAAASAPVAVEPTPQPAKAAPKPAKTASKAKAAPTTATTKAPAAKAKPASAAKAPAKAAAKTVKPQAAAPKAAPSKAAGAKTAKAPAKKTAAPRRKPPAAKA